MTPAITPSARPTTSLSESVVAAVASVTDPEYPDISIADLGMVERIDLDGRRATVGLIPTFSGCPALPMIAADVRSAVEALDAVDECSVEWLSSPVWSTERVTLAARSRLNLDYTVTLRRKDGSLRCPSCGADTVADQSAAGPTRCRSVAWCSSCRNVVEVLR